MPKLNDFRLQRPLGSEEIAEGEEDIGEYELHGGNGGAAKHEMSDGQTCASLMSKSDGFRNVAISKEILDST